MTRAIGFVLTPIIIIGFGDETYGIYTLVLSFVGYFSLLELGIPGALVKYVAEYIGRKDSGFINILLSSALVFKLGLALISTGILLIIGQWGHQWFNIPEHQAPLFHNLVYIVIFVVVITQITEPWGSAVQGFQLFYVQNLFELGLQLLYAGAAFWIVRSQLPIQYLAYTLLAIAILRGTINLLVYLRVMPEVRLTLNWTNVKRGLTKILSFSLGMFLLSVAYTLSYQTDITILGIYLLPEQITYYRIAATIVLFIRNLNGMMSSVLMPTISESFGAGQETILASLKYSIPKLSTIAIIPLVVFIFIFAKPIILFWMGSKYLHVVPVLQLFISYWFFTTLSTLGAFLLGLGKFKPVLIIAWTGVIVNLVVSIIGVQIWGVYGVVLGTVVQYIATIPLQVVLYFRALNIQLKKFVRDVWVKMYGVSLLIILFAYLLFKWFPVETLWVLIVKCGMFLAISYLLFWALALNEQERKYFYRILQPHRV